MDEQVDYVQALWDLIAMKSGQTPLHEWQQTLLRERLLAHQRDPGAALPWRDVVARVQARVQGGQ